jgi:hypothetical protein
VHAIAGDTDGVDGQEEIAGALLRPTAWRARAARASIRAPAWRTTMRTAFSRRWAIRSLPGRQRRGIDLAHRLQGQRRPGQRHVGLLHARDRRERRTSFNQDANSVGLGYLYPLSKRTGLYAAYGHIWNHNGAGYTVANNSEAGTGNTAYNLGIRHSF